ncbi:MAG: alpha/beta fold hydrolase [Natronosporangium sp.]
MRLLLLHAFPLDGRMWLGQRGVAAPGGTWAPTLYRLGASIEDWAAALAGYLDAGPTVVVGCSIGGSCALELVRQAGDRVAALVLVSTKAGHRPEPAQRDGYLSVLRAGGVPGLWRRMAGQFFDPDADPAVVAQARALAYAQRPGDLAGAITAFHSRPDLTGVVERWDRPLTVVVGERDGVAADPVARAAALAARAPRGQLRVVPGAGHFPNLQRTAEFNAILAGTIRSCMEPPR